MEKREKIILMFIIIISVIILLIAVMLANVGNNNSNNNSNNKITNISIIQQNKVVSNNIIEEINDDIQIKEEEKETDNKLKNLNDRTKYFTINNIYIKYVEAVGNKETAKLNNMLSNEYKTKYNVTDSNIYSKLIVPSITNSSQYYKTVITEVLTAQIDKNINIYMVKGKCRIVNMENSIININIMVEMDEASNIYTIYPEEYIIDNGYNNLSIGDSIRITPEKIEKNDNNKFTFTTKTDSEIANLYFNNFKELLMNYEEEAYKKLDLEYSNKRFGSEGAFKKYLEDNKTTIAIMSIDKYKAVNCDTYVDYICSDQYNNIYIFRQKDGIANYTAFLDKYTVMPEYEQKEYNEYEKFYKEKYNLTKFINMVNTKDYNAIYNVLDNTFKSNNFKTIESLKKYMQENFYSINEISLEGFDDETYEYCVFNCKITNMKNTNESKNVTIIINQQEDTNFTMSFSFN